MMELKFIMTYLKYLYFRATNRHVTVKILKGECYSKLVSVTSKNSYVTIDRMTYGSHVFTWTVAIDMIKEIS